MIFNLRFTFMNNGKVLYKVKRSMKNGLEVLCAISNITETKHQTKVKLKVPSISW